MLTDLIETFKAHKVPYVRFKSRAYFIHELADPEVARGRCSSASHAFFDFLYDTYPARNADGYQAHIGILYLTPNSHRLNFHYANVIRGTVVDWTGRQFDPDTPWPLVEPMERYLERCSYAELVVRAGHTLVPSPCLLCTATNAGPCPPPGLITPLQEGSHALHHV